MVEIPFAEGSPPDDLQVESVGDEVLIGDPDTDQINQIENQFDENLAEKINDRELQKKASTLISLYEDDKSARSEWEERYKKG